MCDMEKYMDIYKELINFEYDDIEKIKIEVEKILGNDNSGHDMNHINRVLKLSLKFSEKVQVDKSVVALIALLHDVDDYKLFGEDNAKNLTNAKIIMDKVGIDIEIEKKVLSELKCIGYSKRLKGIEPVTLEGKIVSDADMCDVLGVTGILRVYKYSIKMGKPFFDRNIFPMNNLTQEKYMSRCADSSVCHLFEKILKLKYMMLTDMGRVEAENRHQIIVDILYHLFDEENALEWKNYLDNYLKNLNNTFKFVGEK